MSSAKLACAALVLLLTTSCTTRDSPGFNPIEMAFSKLKALLRKAAARTVDELWSAVTECIRAFKPDECSHYFQAAAYDPD